MQALVLDASAKTARLRTIPIPVPSSNELLVKVAAIALNPVDALYTFNPLGSTGRTVGSDFSGTVAALGSSVRRVSPNFQIGVQVAGFVQGACSVNDRPGAFAEYVVVPWDLVWVVPDSVSLINAAAVSLCALTAAQALHLRLGISNPYTPSQDQSDKPPLTLFLYGASTSVALYAAQLAYGSSQLSRRKTYLFGAASRKHHKMLLNWPYYYDGLVDYRESDWPEKLRILVAEKGAKGVDLAFDCISEGTSVAKTASLLVEGGKIAVVRSREGGAWEADEGTLPSEPLYGAVWEGLGERIEYQGLVVEASDEARSFSIRFYQFLSWTPLVPNPTRRMPGGLSKVVEDGFALLGSGKMEDRVRERTEEWMKPISGEKIVYQIGYHEEWLYLY